jgi:hypothetical protein
VSFKTALRERLKAAPDLAGVPVEWSRRPEGTYPAVVLTTASDEIGRYMTGTDGLRRPRVQFDVFALDAGRVEQLRDAVLSVIQPAELVAGVRFGRAQQMRIVDMSEETDTDFVFRDMIEAVMPHQLEN